MKPFSRRPSPLASLAAFDSSRTPLAVAVLATARAHGCTCEPDIARRGEFGGVARIVLAHADDCALLTPGKKELRKKGSHG